MYRLHVNQPQVRKANINKIMNELAHDFFSELKPTSLRPSYNIVESGDHFRMEFALPGISKKEIAINVEKGLLNVKVVRETKEEAKDETKVIRKEFDYTNFDKKFRLPKSVDPNNISAKMEKGILTLTMQKKEEAKEQPPREIVIK